MRLNSFLPGLKSQCLFKIYIIMDDDDNIPITLQT